MTVFKLPGFHITCLSACLLKLLFLGSDKAVTNNNSSEAVTNNNSSDAVTNNPKIKLTFIAVGIPILR